MFLKYLKIENFMLFRDIELNFSESHPVIGIIGKYEDEAGRSNRAGKSTLIEAISYLLYGMSRVGSRGHKRLVNRSAAKEKKGFRLEGTWTLDDGEELNIVRIRDHKGGSPVVLVNGHEGAGVEESNKIIADKIGFTYNEYFSTSYFGQGDIHNFMTASPADKRALLLTWLNQSRWEKRYKYAKEQYDLTNSELESYTIALNSLPEVESIDELNDIVNDSRNELIILDEQVESVKSKLNELKIQYSTALDQSYLEANILDYQNQIEDLEDKLEFAIENAKVKRELEERYARYQDNKKKKVFVFDKEISELETRREAKEISFRKKYEAEKEAAQEDHLSEVESCRKEWDGTINRLTVSESTCANLYKDLQSKYDKFNKHDGLCPILNESCSRINNDESITENINKAKSDLHHVRDELAQAIESKRNELDDLLKQKEFTLKKLEDTYIKDLETLASEFGEKIYKQEAARKVVLTEYAEKELKLKQELNKIKTEPVDFYEQKLEELDGLLSTSIAKKVDHNPIELINEDIVVEETRLDTLSHSRNDLYSKHNLAQEKLKQAQDNNNKRQELVSKSEKLKVLLSELSYCKYMFSSQGIPNEIITSSFNLLEEDVNYLLEQMNTGLEVEFKPYNISKAYEPNCLACGEEFGSRQRKCKLCGETRQHKRTNSLVLNIHDKKENAVSSFEVESGGGQTLISFAIRLALFFLKVRNDNCQVPAVILDEISSALDPINSAEIMQIVTRVLTEEFNVEQVFMISHNTEELDALENKLIVMRYADHSEVEWG